METKGFDTVYTLAFVCLGFVLLYLVATYILGNKETFVAAQVATPVKKSPPIPVEREVSPSGPSAPNAKVSNSVAKENDVYNVVPTDPNDEKYASQDIKDNMRYPERMFGPGQQGETNDIMLSNGVGSRTMSETNQNIQPFAADLVQNGAMFGDVSPNSTDSPSYYSSF